MVLKNEHPEKENANSKSDVPFYIDCTISVHGSSHRRALYFNRDDAKTIGIFKGQVYKAIAVPERPTCVQFLIGAGKRKVEFKRSTHLKRSYRVGLQSSTLGDNFEKRGPQNGWLKLVENSNPNLWECDFAGLDLKVRGAPVSNSDTGLYGLDPEQIMERQEQQRRERKEQFMTMVLADFNKVVQGYMQSKGASVENIVHALEHATNQVRNSLNREALTHLLNHYQGSTNFGSLPLK